MISEIPNTFDWNALRRVLAQMRQVFVTVEQAIQPSRVVKNLTATPKAGGVIIMFTCTDGDRYILYRNTVFQLDGVVRIDLRNSGIYTDDIGKSSETRYYWVIARKGNIESEPVGPVSATTLGLAVEITPPTPPPAVDEPVYDTVTGYLTES
jgi:hypothetical protein